MKHLMLTLALCLASFAAQAHFCDVVVNYDEFQEVTDALRRSRWNPVFEGKAPGKLERLETIEYKRVNYGENGLRPVAVVTYALYLNRGGSTSFLAWHRSFSVMSRDKNISQDLMQRAQSKAFLWLRLDPMTRCD